MSITIVSQLSNGFENIKALREKHLGKNPGNEEHFEKNEMLRDSCSYHFAYVDSGVIVGALRITPMGHGITLPEKLLHIRDYFDKPFSTFDANRLVLEREYRGGRLLHDFLLEVSIWLRRNTTFSYICVLCRSKLTKIYEGIGGEVIESDINGILPKDRGAYSLVSLSLDNVYHTLSRRKSNAEVF